MATSMSDLACDPIPTSELKRRWSAVRKAMEERGIDVLLMQNNNDYHGGYVKWFTDNPAAYGTYTTVIFPRDDDMTVVGHGNPDEIHVEAGDPINRGVRKLINRPTFAAVEYTRNYHSDVVVEELGDRRGQTIGIVGESSMTAAFLDGVRKGLSASGKFVSATDFVDEIKAVKSAVEIELIRRCAAMQDKAMDAVARKIHPGMRCFELTSLARYVGEGLGSENGLFTAVATPMGQPRGKLGRHLQNREIRPGDVFDILIENNGPGGYYCEVARTFVMGKASAKMNEEFAFVLEAQRYTLDALAPGADPAEIIARHNDFMRRNGRPEERRLYAHGQGYDLVERPMIYPEETMKLAAGMNIVVHPGYVGEDAEVGICDNYLLLEDGVSECLHKTPQKIFEIN